MARMEKPRRETETVTPTLAPADMVLVVAGGESELVGVEAGTEVVVVDAIAVGHQAKDGGRRKRHRLRTAQTVAFVASERRSSTSSI
jgi:hypothetical protein